MDELLERYYALAPTERKKVLAEFNKILKPKKTKKQKYGTNIEKLEEPADKVLYEKLRRWRNKVASDLDVKPWIVFHNQTLTNLAYYRPENTDQLIKINGIGEEKCGKYGEEIINLVNSKMKNEDLSNALQDVSEDVKLPTQRFLKPNK